MTRPDLRGLPARAQKGGRGLRQACPPFPRWHGSPRELAPVSTPEYQDAVTHLSSANSAGEVDEILTESSDERRGYALPGYS